jgi:hypothetical protein
MRRRLFRRYVLCFPVKGQIWDEADVKYEAALSASKNVNVPILLYLARAWYAWATRESNISGMAKALLYCQQVCFSSNGPAQKLESEEADR